MKKTLLIILSLVFIILCSGCAKREKYQLLFDETEIESVSIVYISEVQALFEKYDVVKEITDIEAFLDDFEQLVFHKLIPITLDGCFLFDIYAIKIKYKNGAYEIIHGHQQTISYDGEEKLTPSKNLQIKQCDLDAFNALIDRLLDE